MYANYIVKVKFCKKNRVKYLSFFIKGEDFLDFYDKIIVPELKVCDYYILEMKGV